MKVHTMTKNGNVNLFMKYMHADGLCWGKYKLFYGSHFLFTTFDTKLTEILYYDWFCLFIKSLILETIELLKGKLVISSCSYLPISQNSPVNPWMHSQRKVPVTAAATHRPPCLHLISLVSHMSLFISDKRLKKNFSMICCTNNVNFVSIFQEIIWVLLLKINWNIWVYCKGLPLLSKYITTQ